MEFDKYEKYGAYHWDEYQKKTQYGMHARKVKNWIKEEGKKLDIGSGDGLITSLINAEGIDTNKVAIKLANERGVNVIYGSAYAIPKESDSIDIIYFGDVIEHLEFPDKSLKEIKRVLKHNGLLYVVTPPKSSDGKLWDKYHYVEYSPNELKTYVESFDFELIDDIEVVNEYVRMYAKFKLNKNEI